MMYHLAIQLPDHRSLEAEFADEEGSRGDVDDGAGEGFVERGVAVTEASEAGAGAQGRGEGAAEGEEGVLGRVMVIDCSMYVRRLADLNQSLIFNSYHR